MPLATRAPFLNMKKDPGTRIASRLSLVEGANGLDAAQNAGVLLQKEKPAEREMLTEDMFGE